jgi:hypothetical protein
MAYKTILVHVDGGMGVAGRVRLAAELALESHACLVGAVARCLCLSPPSKFMVR